VEVIGGEVGDAVKESVSWEDDETWVVHTDECGEDKVCRVVVGEFCGRGKLVLGSILRSDFVAVVACCFVAVVSIGDEHGFVCDHRAELLDGRQVADWPEGVFHTEMIDGFGTEDTEKFRFEEVLDFVFGVRV